MNINNQLTEKPFFIFGCSRSGTSLLSRMLNQHSKLAVPYESHLFNTFYNYKNKFGDLANIQNRKRFIQDILRTDVMNDWEPKLNIGEVLENISQYNFGGIFDAILQSWTKKNGKVRWGEKTPHHINYWDEIVKIWPKAKIIHVYRDGRDVALSLLDARFGPKTIYANAEYWVKYLTQVDLLKQRINKNKIIEVSYESILENSEFELERICEFINVDFEPGMLEFYKNKANYNTDAQNKENLKRPIIKENKGKWRKKMSDRDVRIFENIAGEQLSKLGYSLEVQNPQISKVEHFYYSKILSPTKKILAMLKNRKGHKDAMIKFIIKLKSVFLIPKSNILHK